MNKSTRLLSHFLFFTAVLVLWIVSLILTNPITAVFCLFIGEWIVRDYYKGFRKLNRESTDVTVQSYISSQYLQSASRIRLYAYICLTGAFVGIVIMFMLNPAAENVRLIAGGIIGAFLGMAFRFYREHVKCFGD